MLILKLAWRNIIGAGLRTWLNVIVLSLAFFMIIFSQSFLQGMNEYAQRSMIDSEVGGGHFWQRSYDPYDPLSLEDSHATLSPAVAAAVAEGNATPVLVTMGTIYPEGRATTVILKGIDPAQEIVDIPAGKLADSADGYIPALIGSRMAKQTGLRKGDFVTVRWRDIGGTFDAADVKITAVMVANLPSVDQGQIWIPLERLREMMKAEGEATFVILANDTETIPAEDDLWIYRDREFLLSDIVEMIKSKVAGSVFFYGLLLFMGLIAVFDTQVLSIWRRRKEMGTMMALGMVRRRIVALFTIEGAIHGILAVLMGAVYGIPILWLLASKGFPLPEISDDWGFALPQRLYPSFGAVLVLGTIALVLVTVTIVSYLPAAKISRLKPTDALRGKMT
jgi:ABC-type lipoprotein release transport system permease subunit